MSESAREWLMRNGQPMDDEERVIAYFEDERPGSSWDYLEEWQKEEWRYEYRDELAAVQLRQSLDRRRE